MPGGINELTSRTVRVMDTVTRAPIGPYWGSRLK
jgi:hypothetical protein